MAACDICGLPGVIHVTFVEDGTASAKWLCADHAPGEFRAAMPKTPDDEVAILRSKLALLDQSVTDANLNAEIRAEMEQLIDDIEAGRKRLNDLL